MKQQPDTEKCRKETDFIGEKDIPCDALYGIHSLRAKENFPFKSPFFIEWYKAIGLVKLACYQTYRKYKTAVVSKYDINRLPFSFPGDDIIDVLIETAKEVSKGKYFDHFIIPSLQGGAGTSINMNLNEIIANASLLKKGEKPGSYDIIDPIEHANIHQSTNDVIPTTLKVCAMFLLRKLEDSINKLRIDIEQAENKSRNTLRLAYTQMMEAVPSSYGKLFSTYNDALSRDWWRVSKCFERIKVVNIGGSAVGTGVSVPRYFIMEVIGELQRLTNLPVTRSENLPDATANLDPLVEVHAILKAHAVNLEKISADLRLLSSDITGQKDLYISAKQTGSSIMPGKVNPVISEYVISAAHKVYSNDNLITNLAAQSCLDLNPYWPVIGHALIESIKLLKAASDTLRTNLIRDMKVQHETALNKLFMSSAITTSLNPYIGYKLAAKIAEEMKSKNISIFEANKNLGILTDDKLRKIMQPQNLLKTGFQIKDILEDE